MIGGGFTGVSAARQLEARGKRTPTLEARDRVGGRVWSSTFSGLPIEFGATWGKDAYIKGGWTFRPPGGRLGSLRAVRQPHGRLVFAGSDIATGWGGYADGAVETGVRAVGLAAGLTAAAAPATS
ncbi:FAD-dependent oxidoreductase [Streptomyces sp. NPDC048737]|uniref:FAD-dependent oxidoreductase n=1 Tax=unclassified Streptomyces TaxID=2593676 RepID=UPI0034457D40